MAVIDKRLGRHGKTVYRVRVRLQGKLLRVRSALPRKSIEPMGLTVEGVVPQAVRAMQAFISAG